MLYPDTKRKIWTSVGLFAAAGVGVLGMRIVDVRTIPKSLEQAPATSGNPNGLPPATTIRSDAQPLPTLAPAPVTAPPETVLPAGNPNTIFYPTGKLACTGAHMTVFIDERAKVTNKQTGEVTGSGLKAIVTQTGSDVYYMNGTPGTREQQSTRAVQVYQDILNANHVVINFPINNTPMDSSVGPIIDPVTGKHGIDVGTNCVPQ